MKTILQIARISGVLAIALSGSPSGAETIAAAAPARQTQSKGQPGILLRAKDVLNAKVFSNEGVELGRIRDVLFDPKTGEISHAVVGTGGWQGIGEIFAIVPWDFVMQDEQRAENYVLKADAEKFKGAPTFERNQWATAVQPEYLAKVQKYFESPSKPQQAKSQQPTPATPQPQSEQAASTTQPESTSATLAEHRPRKKLQIEQLPRPASEQNTSKAQPEMTPVKQAEQHSRKKRESQQRPRYTSGKHKYVRKEDRCEKVKTDDRK